MDLQLTGKRAVITGGEPRNRVGGRPGAGRRGRRRGAGRASPIELRDAAAGLAGLGAGRVVTAVCDTGDDEAVTAMAAHVRSQLGGVEILVNSAALANTGPMSDDMLDEQLNVKLKGYLRCARAFAPGMVAGGWGRIINISGLAARQTGSVVGSVRNVAVSAMTKNLADEYGAAGVNVTVVHPG